VIALCDGVEIGYDDVGTGMPVAFIHGFPHNRTLWAPQVSALVDRARCIALDLRGFGESSKHGPFSIDQFADDLAMLLRTLARSCWPIRARASTVRRREPSASRSSKLHAHVAAARWQTVKSSG